MSNIQHSPKPPGYIARFDSAWGMLSALSNCLSGRDFPGIGMLPQSRVLAHLVRAAGRRIGQRLYALTGWSETIPLKELSQIRAEDISRAVVAQYERVSSEAVMIGSANGALAHLCAAMRAPWLPQTFLIPLRRHSIDPDDIHAGIEYGREAARPMLDNNPELVLHHMHDPDHDRLMVRRMSYFRVKRTSLGDTYSRFLEEKMRAGATIYLIDCGFTWSASQVGERHFFQLGGAGGVTDNEYLNGSERVSRFLEREGSSLQRWHAPAADTVTPEGEWGFQPQLGHETVALARRHGSKVVRISFDDPEDMSPLVADFYRWWYEQRGIRTNHLLTGSFIFLDPYWTLRTGSVPFWLVFNGRRSSGHLNRYLSEVSPYDHIYTMLLSNGVNPIEGVSIDDWRAVLERASVSGEFVGVDEDRFPYDFASFLRYNAALQKQVPFRHETPAPATAAELDAFLAARGHRYRVKFEQLSPAS